MGHLESLTRARRDPNTNVTHGPPRFCTELRKPEKCTPLWRHAAHDKQYAIAMLEKAYQEHFDVLLLRSPAFDSLRSEPEFRNIMQRIGLSTVEDLSL